MARYHSMAFVFRGYIDISQNLCLTRNVLRDTVLVLWLYLSSQGTDIHHQIILSSFALPDPNFSISYITHAGNCLVSRIIGASFMQTMQHKQKTSAFNFTFILGTICRQRKEIFNKSMTTQKGRRSLFARQGPCIQVALIEIMDCNSLRSFYLYKQVS